VARILVPGWDRVSSEAALELAARHPDLLAAAVGIHPHYVAEATAADWEAIEILATSPGARAVGEVGLDFFRNVSPPDVQRDALRRQLDLAARVRKPVVVHDREAHAEVTAALVTHAAASGVTTPGILHAFSGDAAMAAALADAHYLVSFAHPVSYAKNLGPRSAAAAIPADHLLVETDAPYLGPASDQRNEPTTTLRTAAVIADLRDEPVEAVAAAAGANLARALGDRA
jgi:TatD DNase family protein